MLQPRPYQKKMIDDTRAAFARGAKSVLVVGPTGCGKTVFFSLIAEGAMRLKKRVLVLVHRRELLRQASQKLFDAGVEHGIIAQGFSPTNDLVQVGSVQTVGRRLSEIGKFDIIVIDECHHAISSQYQSTIESQENAKLLGVTATPERLDGRGLGRLCGGYFDELVLGPTVSELTDSGYLVPFRIFAPTAPDLSGIRTRMGDFETAGLVSKIDVPTITGDVVAHYKRLADGLPTIAFCVTVDHARHVAATFQAAGYRAIAAHGAMPTHERDAAINGLSDGSIQILCSCDLVSEGLDVPGVAAVILLRPTKSLCLYLQQIGRGLRPAPGKKHLIVLDHANCVMTHGLPDSPREWTLDGKKKKEAAISLRQCKSCYAIHKTSNACPECGYVYKTSSSEGRIIEQKDGVLEEISGERLEMLRNTPIGSLLKKATSRADLVEIQKARGYKPGWVHYMNKNRRFLPSGAR